MAWQDRLLISIKETDSSVIEELAKQQNIRLPETMDDNTALKEWITTKVGAFKAIKLLHEISKTKQRQ